MTITWSETGVVKTTIRFFKARNLFTYTSIIALIFSDILFYFTWYFCIDKYTNYLNEHKSDLLLNWDGGLFRNHPSNSIGLLAVFIWIIALAVVIFIFRAKYKDRVQNKIMIKITIWCYAVKIFSFVAVWMLGWWIDYPSTIYNSSLNDFSLILQIPATILVRIHSDSVSYYDNWGFIGFLILLDIIFICMLIYKSKPLLKKDIILTQVIK